MASREHKTPARARVAYPLALNTTTNNASAGLNNASSASPSNSGGAHYPPTAAQAKESLRSKRPADSPISLNVDKRARINGSSEQTRSNTASPATSRQNSMTATVGPSPARRPSAMSSGGNVVHASRDPRRQGTGHVGSASPMHAASPLSLTNGDAGQHGSGNTTPIHGAPPAPSMVPHRRVPGVGGARGIATIRQTVAKKQTLPGVSENTVLASIRAKHIDLQNEMKKITDQQALLQSEQTKATAQREHADIGLKEQLNQSQVKLDLEMKKRLEVEQRLEALESKFKQFQNKPADSVLLTQMNELSSKVRQLESLPRSDAPAITQAQIEKSVEQLVQSGIMAHGDKITELEMKVTAFGTDLEKSKPNYEAFTKHSLKEGIIPLEYRLDTVEAGARSITTCIDALVNENNKSRLDQLEGGLVPRVDKLEKDVNTMTTKSDKSDKRVKNLSEKDIQALKQDMENLKKANSSKEISDLTSAFAAEKQNTTKQFKEVKSEMREKATMTQYESVAKQLEGVSAPVQLHVEERIEEQVPLHVNRTIAALKEDIENNIKRDIGTDIAKIREEIARIHGDVERNGITLTELQSWAGRKETTVNDLISSVSQSRVSIASMEKGLRSDMELDLSSALTDMQLELLNFKTETSSTFKTLRDDMARSRTVPAPSPADPVVTASVLQGFATKENVERLDGRLQKVETDLQGSTIIERLDKLDSHLREVEGTAKTALADATAVVDTTIGIAGDMDTFTSTTRTIEEAMEALREQVASLHEQPSSGPNHAVSGLTSLVLGSDHDATNIVREDTRAGNDAIEDRLQSQERAIKSLTSQYENITTDFLHQRMSHWIAENYPDAPGFLNELNRMQGKQRQFEAFVNDMSWMSADTQQAIQQLLRDKDRLGHPNAWEEFGSIRKKIDIEAQTRTQENKALRDELATECADRKRLAAGLEPVHDAFGKILPEVRLLRNELNHLKPKVASMEITFDNLKPTVEFLVTEFGGLKPSVQRLETEFGNLGPKVELLGPKVELLKATTDKLDTAKKLSDTSIRELNDQKGHLDKRLQDAETSIQKHRQDIDTQDQSIDNVKTTIEQRRQTLETHQQLLKEFRANIATLMVSAYEVQKFSLMMNTCLKLGGFKNIKFSHTFSEPTSPNTWTSL